uniref:Uncharacterized protein n=1 Tax=Avena sativa TaxID=4498 RepID=A0ACD5XL44_AVESA
METVILPRSAEIVAAEGALRWALVAFVSGQRSSVSLIEAGAAVMAQVPRAEDNLTVHRSWPADFLLVCSSRRVRDDIMAAGVIDGRGFSLRFSPWNRQLQAVRRSLRYRAHLELTGIPAHAWNRTTAVALLGSAVWIERLGAATASREDLGHFQVVAWIDSSSHLLPEKALLIEELDDLMEEDDGLVLPGDALIPLEKLMLRYVVKIRLVRAEDMATAGLDPPPGDGGDSDEEDTGRRDRGGGRDGGDVHGGLDRGAAARPGPHGDRRGDGPGDAARLRRSSDVGWVATDVSPLLPPWRFRHGLSLSPVDVDSDQRAGPEITVASATTVVTRSPAAFREACKQPINTVLSRPVAKRCRNKRKYSGPVRRSGRIHGRFAPGTPIRQQQRTLITRLGIAREGEVIGDEALDAYLDLFARPLRQQHIDVVLRLFGWMPEALPMFDDAPVECLV